MSRRERNVVQLQEVVREFERFPGDTGSSEVQGALPSPPTHTMHTHAPSYSVVLAGYLAIVRRHCAVGSWRICPAGSQRGAATAACLLFPLLLLLLPPYLAPLSPCASRCPAALHLTLYVSFFPHLSSVALLTRKIQELAVHMRQHRKDYSSRRWVAGRCRAVLWQACVCVAGTGLSIYGSPGRPACMRAAVAAARACLCDSACLACY